jgi:hypothetical protein
MRERLRPNFVESHTATTLLAAFTMARFTRDSRTFGVVTHPLFDIESVYSKEKYVRMHLFEHVLCQRAHQ